MYLTSKKIYSIIYIEGVNKWRLVEYTRLQIQLLAISILAVARMWKEDGQIINPLQDGRYIQIIQCLITDNLLIITDNLLLTYW